MWNLATLIAAAALTGRNAAQAGLTGQIGTIGATAVRFIFGLPFAALFLVVLSWRLPLPAVGGATLAWAALGAGAQIAATVATGITAGALFGLSAIGFRGAILALPEGSALLRAAVVLVIALSMQSLVMVLWLALRQPRTLGAIARSWRVSLLAGALGAFASLFWFIGFALTSAANVRTLALIEVFFAQILSARLFREGARPRQILGMALIVAGVALLIRVA